MHQKRISAINLSEQMKYSGQKRHQSKLNTSVTSLKCFKTEIQKKGKPSSADCCP